MQRNWHGLSLINYFTNLLLEGKCHDEVSPIIFGGSLIVLTKKSGGIRPIAIGYTLRRLAAKCANTYAVAKLADYFRPIQLGVGVPDGCEAAVHATRRFIEHMLDDQVIVKLDFTIAFNSLHRGAMLEAISARVPAIYTFCHLAYNQPSILKFFEHRIMTAEGPQQEPAFRDFLTTSKENAPLLDAPLTDGPALNDALEARCADIDRTIGRLRLLPAHDALTLLKSSFSAPKIVHTLCCSPCHSHDALH